MKLFTFLVLGLGLSVNAMAQDVRTDIFYEVIDDCGGVIHDGNLEVSTKGEARVVESADFDFLLATESLTECRELGCDDGGGPGKDLLSKGCLALQSVIRRQLGGKERINIVIDKEGGLAGAVRKVCGLNEGPNDRCTGTPDANAALPAISKLGCIDHGDNTNSDHNGQNQICAN